MQKSIGCLIANGIISMSPLRWCWCLKVCFSFSVCKITLNKFYRCGEFAAKCGLKSETINILFFICGYTITRGYVFVRAGIVLKGRGDSFVWPRGKKKAGAKCCPGFSCRLSYSCVCRGGSVRLFFWRLLRVVSVF